MSSVSSRAIWLSLTSTVMFKFSGWMNAVFIPLLIMKVAGTVCYLLVGLKRNSSQRSKSVTAVILTFRLSTSSTGVLFCVLIVFRCVIKACCRKTASDTFRFGFPAWIARFTVWTAHSASPFALGCYMGDCFFLIPSDLHHCFKSTVTNSGPLSETNVFGIPKLAKIWLKYTFTVCEVIFPTGKTFYPAWSRVYYHLDISLILNETPVHIKSFPSFCFWPSKYCFPQARPVFLAFLTFTDISENILTDAGPPSHHSDCCFSCIFAWVGHMSFGHHHMSEVGLNERHNSSKDDSAVDN